jgi:hypothetical protein
LSQRSLDFREAEPDDPLIGAERRNQASPCPATDGLNAHAEVIRYGVRVNEFG